MPELSDAFLTLAEIGVGLAGFSSIALALTRRDAPLTPAQAIYVRELILNSLAVIFMALLPVGLILVGIPDSIIWRGLSAFHAALIVFVAWPVLLLQVRGIEVGDRDQAIYVVVLAVQLATVVLQSLNFSGILFSPSGGVYFFSLLGPLAIGTIHFARLLFSRLL
jgi:hypothetical protein